MNEIRHPNETAATVPALSEPEKNVIIGGVLLAMLLAALDRWSDNCRMMQQAPAMPKGEAAEPLPDPFEETLGG